MCLRVKLITLISFFLINKTYILTIRNSSFYQYLAIMARISKVIKKVAICTSSNNITPREVKTEPHLNYINPKPYDRIGSGVD